MTITAKEEETVIHEELNPTGDELTMGEVIKVLNELTNGDAIIVTDVGQHQMVACRYAKFNQTQKQYYQRWIGYHGLCLAGSYRC